MQTRSHPNSGLAAIAADFTRAATQRTFSTKATIVGQGDESRDLFFILSGSVTFRLETPSGHDLVLAIAHAGEFFGETGLFEAGAMNAWRVRARSVCNVAHISHAQLENDLPLLTTLWPTLTMQLAARLDRQERKAGQMAFCDAPNRVHNALLELASAPDAQRKSDGYGISVTRVELASMAAVSREAVGRILMRLQRQGLIRVKGRAMVVVTNPGSTPQETRIRPVRHVGGVSATL